MFKENWPLTGLVKLLNPAGGRRLRLIHEQEDCKAVSSASGCWPGDHHASQDTNDVQQFGGSWPMIQGSRKRDVGRHRKEHGCGRLSTRKSDRLVSDTAGKQETE